MNPSPNPRRACYALQGLACAKPCNVCDSLLRGKPRFDVLVQFHVPNVGKRPLERGDVLTAEEGSGIDDVLVEDEHVLALIGRQLHSQFARDFKRLRIDGLALLAVQRFRGQP